ALLARLVHDDAAREEAVVVVRNALRAGEIEGSVRPLSPKSTLQIELANALAQHAVARVHVLVELELVAQIARNPVAVAKIVLEHEEIPVEPAPRFLQAAFQLRVRRKRARVIRLHGELASQRAGTVNLALRRWARARAVRVLRLSPQQRIVLVSRPVEAHFCRELVLARLDRVLDRE